MNTPIIKTICPRALSQALNDLDFDSLDGFAQTLLKLDEKEREAGRLVRYTRKNRKKLEKRLLYAARLTAKNAKNPASTTTKEQAKAYWRAVDWRTGFVTDEMLAEQRNS
jgi:hypothetical protein